MPTSDPSIITPIASKIISIKPNSVLDIGIGMGKWGVMVREYSDAIRQRCQKKDWKVHLDGIEVFERYSNPIWEVYNNIYIGNVLDVLPTLERTYDMIIMVEVLEHIEKDIAIRFISTVLEKSNKHLILTYTNSSQCAWGGNKYETHVSTWTDSDLKQYNREKLYSTLGGRCVGYLITK